MDMKIWLSTHLPFSRLLTEYGVGGRGEEHDRTSCITVLSSDYIPKFGNQF